VTTQPDEHLDSIEQGFDDMIAEASEQQQSARLIPPSPLIKETEDQGSDSSSVAILTPGTPTRQDTETNTVICHDSGLQSPNAGKSSTNSQKFRQKIRE